MRKNDLIKKLQGMRGNPHVTIWNGFVEDYQHIGDVSKESLYRESRNFRLKLINLERENEGLPPLMTEDFEFEPKYEFKNEFLSEAQVLEWYDKKIDTIILQVKRKNKTVHDRTGSLTY